MDFRNTKSLAGKMHLENISKVIPIYLRTINSGHYI